MKKLLGLFIIGFVLLNFTFVFGAEKTKLDFTITEKDDSKKQDNPYLLIENKNIRIKVYKCGRVTKETWKEINPNEETDCLCDFTTRNLVYYS